MAPRIEIIKPKLLLVEGVDAYFFFMWACKAFGVNDVQVMNFGGITDLTEYLKTLPMVPGYEQVKTIAIARDAENDPAAAVSNVKRALKQINLPVPSIPFEFAGIIPRVAFMFFPGTTTDVNGHNILSPGTLEDLCIEIVKDCSTFGCVDLFIQCLQSKGQEIKRLHKTRLHTYLAGNNDFVGLKIGEASKAGAWDWNHSKIDPFRKIILEM